MATGSTAVRVAAIGLGLLGFASAGRAQSTVWSVEGRAPWDVGPARGSIADLDHDGHREVVASAPHALSERGLVEIRSGATGDLLRTWVGETVGDNFGYDADGAGDVDGDGVEDLVVGAPFCDEAAGDAGKVYVFSGADGSLLWSHRGPGADSRLGEHVCGIGDVDGDGRADVAASAASYDHWRGRVEVLRGATGNLLYALQGESPADVFGRIGVSSGPDFDDDGRPDLLITAEGWSGNRGRAYLCSGATGATLRTFEGQDAGDLFGTNGVFGGDVDGDGVRDLLIGAQRHDGPNGVDSGRIYVYSGATFAVLGTVDGLAPDDYFAGWFACLGDLDGDGRDEIGAWVSYYDGDGGHRSGRTLVYNARTLRTMFELDGEQADEYFGEVVSRAVPLGDVTGDGVPDFATGTTLFDNQFGADVGELAVFALAPLGLESFPPAPRVGDAVVLSTLGGVPQALSADVVVELDGMPMFLVLAGVARLDFQGERALGGTVPAELAGHSVKVRSYAMGVRGNLVASNDEILAFH